MSRRVFFYLPSKSILRHVGSLDFPTALQRVFTESEFFTQSTCLEIYGPPYGFIASQIENAVYGLSRGRELIIYCDRSRPSKEGNYKAKLSILKKKIYKPGGHLDRKMVSIVVLPTNADSHPRERIKHLTNKDVLICFIDSERRYIPPEIQQLEVAAQEKRLIFAWWRLPQENYLAFQQEGQEIHRVNDLYYDDVPF